MKQQSFLVICDNTLGADDLKVLVLLYQPLLKPSGYGLYMFLYALASVNGTNYEYDWQFVADSLALKEKDLILAKERLEALDLLHTYQKENHFIFKIVMPHTAQGFIRDTTLGKFLSTEIGEKNYQALIKRLLVKNVDLSEYQEVTKDFADIYQFENYDLEDDGQYVGRNASQGLRLKTNFVFNDFINMLSSRYKRPQNLSFKVKDTLINLSFIYKFKLEELKEIFESACNNDGVVDLALLSTKANAYFTINNHQNVAVVKKEVDKTNQTLLELETTHPSEIINCYCHNNLHGQALQTIYDLMSRNKIENGYLNILLVHILKLKEGILPNVVYLEKVIKSWHNKGLTTTLEAYNFVTQVTPEKPKTTSKKIDSMASNYLAELRKLDEEND